jgi:uncharacterized membrane protein YfcA
MRWESDRILQGIDCDAVRLLFPDRLPTLGQDVPRRLRVPYGLTIGLSASLIGIGGGILSNMIMDVARARNP